MRHESDHEGKAITERSFLRGCAATAAYYAYVLYSSEGESTKNIKWYLVAVVAFFFAYIFTKGYEGKGIMESIKFGVKIGLFMKIPGAFGLYVMFPIPFSLASGIHHHLPGVPSGNQHITA